MEYLPFGDNSSCLVDLIVLRSPAFPVHSSHRYAAADGLQIVVVQRDAGEVEKSRGVAKARRDLRGFKGEGPGVWVQDAVRRPGADTKRRVAGVDVVCSLCQDVATQVEGRAEVGDETASKVLKWANSRRPLGVAWRGVGECKGEILPASRPAC